MNETHRTLSRRRLVMTAACAVPLSAARAVGFSEAWDNPNVIELDSIIVAAKNGGDPRDIAERLGAIRDYFAWAASVADPRD